MASTLRLGGVLLARSAALPTKWNASTILRTTVWLRPVASSSSLMKTEAPASVSQATFGEDYWVKNKRLSRPLSPHLSIYKPQLTSMLSITHRTTGVLLSVVLSSFGIGMLCLPATYPYYIGLLSQAHYSAGLIFTGKLMMAFPFTFHVMNGLRHLVWDMGHGFSLPALYKSGYSVLALALVSAVALAAY